MKDNHTDNEEMTSTDVINDLVRIKNNPGQIIEYSYRLLDKISNGKNKISNPTNPVSYLLEMQAMQTSALAQAHEVTYREQYPKLANQYHHLYNHMFDEHYIGRFAYPGHCRFDIMFKYEDILNAMQEDGRYNTRKIILPRGSSITVNDYVFTMLYDIEISQLAHGGLQVLYRTAVKDPLQPLSSNIIDWDTVMIEGHRYIRLRPLLLNVKLSQFNDNLLQRVGYTNQWEIKDRFSHCRVYQIKDGIVEEIHTTHSDLVYDAEQVTARLIYLDSTLRVEIPQIYFNKGLVGSQIIVEIYSTAGKVDEPLNEYPPDEFGYRWGKLENNIEDLKFVAPIEELSSPIIIARSMLTGGSNEESFEDTRDRVINFTNYTDVAITPNQLSRSLKVNGYDIVKSRDTITSRIYYATQGLPVNKADVFPSGAACSMETIKTTLNELTNNPAVRDNGKRVTITPELLFKESQSIAKGRGTFEVVNHRDVPKLEVLGVEPYLAEINKLEYAFTPFYYVLDTSDNDFESRAYFLDNPEVYDQIFVANNASSGLSVSSDAIEIVKKQDKNTKEDWFEVHVKTRSTDAYKNVPIENLFCQLAIRPVGDKSFAYINGELVGQTTDTETEQVDYVWVFKLKTRWDITKRHGILLEDFYMFINEPRRFEFALEDEMHFIYGVKGIHNPQHQIDQVDKMINLEIIDEDKWVYGITHDKVKYRLGNHLKYFWSNGISVLDKKEYVRYEEDVPRVYRQDVYDISPDGNFILNDDQLVVLHRAGDPILDEDGQPLYLARKGDPVLDKLGHPIVKRDRSQVQLIEIMLIDGVYFFADNLVDKDYRELIGRELNYKINYDLKEIGDRLLENTKLYFYPKRTMGNTSLLVDNGLSVQEALRLSFSVKYFMNEVSYNNLAVRDAIREMTHEVINEHLEKQTVTTSDIISELRKRAGDDIVAVDIGKFGNHTKFSTFTVKDPSARCSVKRVLKLQPDRSFKVVEDIEVSFIKHDSFDDSLR